MPCFSNSCSYSKTRKPIEGDFILLKRVKIMIKNPIFLSISGSHLYGFPNPEDGDLRGCHFYSKEELFALNQPKETIERNVGNVDMISHEIKKFLTLLLKSNVNFIEETLSPLRIIRTPWYDELREIARDCLSKKCFEHWKGFAKHTSYHAAQEDYKKPKRNLYLLRQYYQGIYLYQTVKFKSNIKDLEDCEVYSTDLVEELLECKANGEAFINRTIFLDHCSFLEKELEKARDDSDIREKPSEETVERAGALLRDVREWSVASEIHMTYPLQIEPFPRGTI